MKGVEKIYKKLDISAQRWKELKLQIIRYIIKYMEGRPMSELLLDVGEIRKDLEQRERVLVAMGLGVLKVQADDIMKRRFKGNLSAEPGSEASPTAV